MKGKCSRCGKKMNVPKTSPLNWVCLHCAKKVYPEKSAHRGMTTPEPYIIDPDCLAFVRGLEEEMDKLCK